LAAVFGGGASAVTAGPPQLIAADTIVAAMAAPVLVHADTPNAERISCVISILSRFVCEL